MEQNLPLVNFNIMKFRKHYCRLNFIMKFLFQIEKQLRSTSCSTDMAKMVCKVVIANKNK